MCARKHTGETEIFCGQVFLCIDLASEGEIMSKGMDRKKEAKKKPAKSQQEKRAAKREKKQSRGFH
jgi:hypothetical protein